MDIVVAQGPPVFELLAGEDEALLVGGDAFFVLNFGFDIVDCVAGFDFEGYGLAGEGFDEAGDGVGWSVAETSRSAHGFVASGGNEAWWANICTGKKDMSVSLRAYWVGCTHS